jgi:hypothetical protein
MDNGILLGGAGNNTRSRPGNSVGGAPWSVPYGLMIASLRGRVITPF